MRRQSAIYPRTPFQLAVHPRLSFRDSPRASRWGGIISEAQALYLGYSIEVKSAYKQDTPCAGHTCRFRRLHPFDLLAQVKQRNFTVRNPGFPRRTPTLVGGNYNRGLQERRCALSSVDIPQPAHNYLYDIAMPTPPPHLGITQAGKTPLWPSNRE